jgi:hypothetical protein
MPFRLSNAPAMILAFISLCLQPYIDDFTVSYVDDMLIYSTNEKEHEAHVRNVLQLLNAIGLYCKTKQCQFAVQEVGYIGFVISSAGIGMESDCMSTIEDCPTPESVQEVQVLLSSANFYRRFIRKYAKVMAPISNLLKTDGLWKWEWTRDAELAL